MLCTLMDYAVEKQLQNRVHVTRILAEDLLQFVCFPFRLNQKILLECLTGVE